MHDRRALFISLMIAAAALARLLPHPPNVAPIMAMALFGGAVLADRRLALLVPLVAMLVSDLFLGLHSQMPLVYGSFMLVVGLGMLLRRRRGAGPLLGATLAGSLVFFLVTNLGVWAFDGLYPRTLDGLAACYLAALPFFHNSLLGNLFFVGVLFGGLALLERRYDWLRRPEPQAG